MRVFNSTPYPGDQIGRVVVWTARTLPLRENWRIEVAWMTTDWWDYHDEGGIAYPDRRGAFIFVPRETLDPWSYIVEVGAHELRHLQQFEERGPGYSLKEPEPEETDVPDETIAAHAVRVVTGAAELDPELLQKTIEHAKKRRQEVEDDAEAAAAERLRSWTEELTISERDSIRFGRLNGPAFWS